MHWAKGGAQLAAVAARVTGCGHGLIWGGFLTAFGMTDARVVQSDEARPLAKLSCRAKRSIPRGVIMLRRRYVAASIKHDLARGIPHCVRNDQCCVGCERRSTSSDTLSCRAKRSIPCGVVVVGRRHCPLHPTSVILHGGFLTAFGMTNAVLGASGEALPPTRCHAERSEASPVAWSWLGDDIARCILQA